MFTHQAAAGRVSKSEKFWTSVHGRKERREEEMNSCGSCMKRYKRVTLVAELIIKGGKISVDILDRFCDFKFIRGIYLKIGFLFIFGKGFIFHFIFFLSSKFLELFDDY